MKKNLALTTILICICSIFFPLHAQNPTYEAYLMNEEFISANEFEFDIYIRTYGTIPFEVYGLRHCLIFDNAVLSGGTPTLAYIPGTSQMNSIQEPTNSNNVTFIVNGKRVIRMPARTATTPGTGTIISNSGDGTRFGRFRLKTTASSFSTWFLDLDWNFDLSYGYLTQYQAYVNGSPVNITMQSHHYNILWNFPLSIYIGYEARLTNDLQTASNSYEFDIYLKDRSYAAHAVAYGIQICLLIQ